MTSASQHNGRRTPSDADQSSATSPGDAQTNGDDADKAEAHVSIAAKAKTYWTKTGITWPLAKLMFKGALTPTIALAAYQSNAWAAQYSTLGYLVAIMAQLSTVFQPRAKFVQTMLVQVLLICLGAGVAVLACYCAVQARISSEGFTSPGQGGPGTSGEASRGAQTTTYNGSASAVAGVWLFLQIYGISSLRARFPQYTIPCIQYAILTNVSMAYAPQFNTIEQAESFVLSLFSAVLTGFAVATGVSLLIFPLTSRSLLFKETNGLISGLRNALGANQAYLISLEDTDMFAAQKTNTQGEKPSRSPEAETVQQKMRAVSASHAKCALNLTYAVREVAIGNLGPDDLKEVHKLLQQIAIPMVGLSSLSDVFDRISEERGWDRSRRFPTGTPSENAPNAEEGRLQSINEWHELLKISKSHFEGLTGVIDEALQHVAITLRLTKQSKKMLKNSDNEATGGTPKPGDLKFAEHLDLRTKEFLKSKQLALRVWCDIHGIELPEDYFSGSKPRGLQHPIWKQEKTTASPERVRLRTQLMILLYVEFLLWKLARRTHTLVLYVDGLRASGKINKTRVVLPGVKRLRKWMLSAMTDEDDDDENYPGAVNVYMGQAYKAKKDPDHLPPKNKWEEFSNVFRRLGRFFGSSKSIFAFRVAVATISIAVINLLQVSQVFFTRERLFWAQIMTSIAMTPSAGQSLRVFLLRIGGTALAMIVSITAYYIVDGKTAGVLVLYFLLNLPGIWLILRHPAFTAVGMISTITLTLTLGYELQVRKIGVQKATSNGQVYYPIYELAPIRLLIVMSGIFVAFIFTIFPYPITEHSQLRKNTANALYLLAKYYSTVDQTFRMRLRGSQVGDENVKGSAAQKLAKARLNTLSKCNTLLASMRSQIAFVKYDIPVGGSFPKAQYAKITERIQNILNFMSLISIASTTFANIREGENEGAHYEWVEHLRALADSANLLSPSVTTLLSLLSASLGHPQPLPPNLKTPNPHTLEEQMDRIDPELLSVRHIAEPGYGSFAVVQIALTCMIDELRDLLGDVRELVGELDFSFHVVGSEVQSTSALDEIQNLRSNNARESERRDKQE